MSTCRSVVAIGVACGTVVSLSLGAPPTYRDAVAAAGPVLWYRLDEASGNIANHGSLRAGWNATAAGAIDRGVQSPGGDTAIGFGQGEFLESIGNSPLTGNPTFSIEVVVRLSSPGAASLWGPFLHWGDGGVNRTGREVYFGIQNANNRRLYAGFYNAGIRTVDVVPANEWLHVVWTRVGGTDSEAGSIVYVNGAPVATQRDSDLFPAFVAPSAIDIGSVPFRVNAGRDFPGARFFTGSLDEIVLYTRVLSGAEIASRARLATCSADFNTDGNVNSQDFFDFLSSFFASEPEADFNRDSAINSQDFFDFLGAFFVGC